MSRIKSQPVYEPLSLVQEAGLHVFVTAGEGAKAAKKLLTQHSAPPHVWWHVKGDGVFMDGAENFSDEAALWQAMEERLAGFPVSTQLYLAGAELFIWSAALRARSAGFSRSRVSTELVGSRARRVMCAHCRAMHELVKHTVFRCEGCGLWLGVRDHYSRLMCAYLAGRVDAEEHGNVPDAEELYA